MSDSKQEIPTSINRILISTYQGPIYRVRRGGDNREEDVDERGCIAGTNITVKEWAKGASVFGCFFYDQSGNGKHAKEIAS